MLKKAALGLTLALTMSTVMACGPNANQGLNGTDTSTYGTTNYGTTTKYYQDGTVNRNWQGNRTSSVGEGYPLGTDGTINNQRGYGTMNGYRDGRIRGLQDGYLDGANDRSRVFGTRNGLRSGYKGTKYNNFNQDRNGFFKAGYDTNRNANNGWNNTAWGLGFNGANNQHAGTYDERASRKIEQRINKLDGVTGSSVVVTDKAVFIGVNTDGKNNRSNGIAGNLGDNNLYQNIRSEAQAEVSGKQIIIFSGEGSKLNNNAGTKSRTGVGIGVKSKSR